MGEALVRMLAKIIPYHEVQE